MSELQRIGEPAVPFLIEALKSGRNSKHRWGAAKVLGAIGDKRAREPLVKQLRNSDQWVRKEAVEALRKITSLDFGYDPEAESAQRETATKKWEEWWNKQKDKEEKAAEEAKKQEEAEKSEAKQEKPETKPEEKKEPESPKE